MRSYPCRQQQKSQWRGHIDTFRQQNTSQWRQRCMYHSLVLGLSQIVEFYWQRSNLDAELLGEGRRVQAFKVQVRKKTSTRESVFLNFCRCVRVDDRSKNCSVTETFFLRANSVTKIMLEIALFGWKCLASKVTRARVLIRPPIPPSPRSHTLHPRKAPWENSAYLIAACFSLCGCQNWQTICGAHDSTFVPIVKSGGVGSFGGVEYFGF